MNLDTTREAYRKAGAELVADLGFDPNDVLEDMTITGRTAEFRVVHRDADGKVKTDGVSVVSHVERKRITAAQLARYQATLARGRENA
jgi:hypothetical protein